MTSAPEFGHSPLDEQALRLLLAPERMEEMTSELRCSGRHLAVATSQLIRAGEVARENQERYATAEALFRALVADQGGIMRLPAVEAPFVQLLDGTKVPLTVLFTSICQRDRLWLPDRSIDPDLVLAAKELLSGLKWRLPGEEDPLP